MSTPSAQSAIHAIQKVAAGSPLDEADKVALRSVPRDAQIPAHVASAISFHGDSLADAARFALGLDAKRRELFEEIVAAASGCFKPLALSAWLSRVHTSRGNPPAAVREALGLGAAATWFDAANALERRFTPKREGAR